jgi:hypothetical protein
MRNPYVLQCCIDTGLNATRGFVVGIWLHVEVGCLQRWQGYKGGICRELVLKSVSIRSCEMKLASPCIYLLELLGVLGQGLFAILMC